MHVSFDASGIDSSSLTIAFVRKFAASLSHSLSSVSLASPREALETVLSLPPVHEFLVFVSRSDVFSSSLAERLSDAPEGLSVLRSLKVLKYCYNLPCSQLVSDLAGLILPFEKDCANHLRTLSDRLLDDGERIGSMLSKNFMVTKKSASPVLRKLYGSNAEWLLEHDPHALYPTSIYRQSSGHVTSSKDSTAIEGIMSTTITTSIEIVRDILHPESTQLRNIYKPLGRCVAIVDERLDGLYGDSLNAYFDSHGIAFDKLIYRCMEVDKDISTVETILADLKGRRVARNEPVLVIGGGVMADVGGFACALYHRNTPYVMLCTSVVSGIDAGPSPRTCCDGLGYKNVFGAYHPPILTFTDRQFFGTLEPGWIRHGIAEVIKMAVTKDVSLFEHLEQAGDRLVRTKFGVTDCERDSEIDELSQKIIAKAMDGYVRSEYGNLWETHQCRPHAYGHTWSPGFELQAGLLHGHAVAIGMGYGAYLALLEGWISESEFRRILNLMSVVGLSLRHDVLENSDLLWSSQVKMTEKRGGNLCAPLPRGGLGKCGYLNYLSKERMESTLREYQQICREYEREGLGVEPHCKDVGLEDPSTVKQHADHAVLNGNVSNDNGEIENGTKNAELPIHDIGGVACTGETENIRVYQEWISKRQMSRNAGGETSSSIAAAGVDKTSGQKHEVSAPKFEHATLFHESVEEYAAAMTTPAAPEFVQIAAATTEAGLFAPCMVGQIEGQFLKMMTRINGAKRVLDIGTFTGYSALAFAQGLPHDGEVVSIEADAKCAAVARTCFQDASDGCKIRVIEADAYTTVTNMVDNGELFDIVFLDADKTNYRHYYEAGLQLLAEGGLVMADNALCALLYEGDDPVRQKLHEFNQFVRTDERVEQVMLTVREGIMMVQKKAL